MRPQFYPCANEENLYETELEIGREVGLILSRSRQRARLNLARAARDLNLCPLYLKNLELGYLGQPLSIVAKALQSYGYAMEELQFYICRFDELKAPLSL